MQIITVTGSLSLTNDMNYQESMTLLMEFLGEKYNTFGLFASELADVKDILSQRNSSDETTVSERVDTIQQAIWSLDSELRDDEHISMETTRDGLLISCTKPEICLEDILTEISHYNPSAHDYVLDNSVVTVAEFKNMLYAEAAGHNGETNRSALALLLNIEDSVNQLDLGAVLHKLQANGYTGPINVLFY